MSLSRCAIIIALGVLSIGCAGNSSPRKTPNKDQDAAVIQVKLGQEYMSKGDLETAQDKLQRAISLDPKSVDAYTLLGILNERIGRNERAERFYRDAVRLTPEDGSVNNNLGTFLCGVGRFEEAEEHFQAALADPFYKTPGMAYSNAGVCARKSGKLDRAEQYFRRALELDPGNLTALYELAAVSFEREDYLRARAFIQRYDARAGADASMLLLAIKVETRLGDERAAQRYRDRLAKDFPDVIIPADRTAESP